MLSHQMNHSALTNTKQGHGLVTLAESVLLPDIRLSNQIDLEHPYYSFNT